jgi:hypothetical protein
MRHKEDEKISKSKLAREAKTILLAHAYLGVFACWWDFLG